MIKKTLFCVFIIIISLCSCGTKKEIVKEQPVIKKEVPEVKKRIEESLNQNFKEETNILDNIIIGKYELNQKIFNPKVDWLSVTFSFKNYARIKVESVKVQLKRIKNKAGDLINPPEIFFEDIFYCDPEFYTYRNINFWWQKQSIGVSGFSMTTISNFNIETDVKKIAGIYDLFMEAIYPDIKLKQKFFFKNIEVTDRVINDLIHNQYRNR